MAVISVIFDVGETLLDDSREFGAWADWIGVPRHTFSAVLGAVTAAGRDNAETFQYFRPGFDLAAERERREQAGAGENYGEADLYPDARSALAALREMGLWVGIAGNQTAKAAGLRAAHIRRGPWGHLWADDPRVVKPADWRITSLAELPGLLAAELQQIPG